MQTQPSLLRRGHSVTAPMEMVLITIVVALVFDFINGFHDAANQHCNGSVYSCVVT